MEADETLGLAMSGKGRMTCREAIAHFFDNPPKKQLPIPKLGATIAELREQLEQQDNAGSKMIQREKLVATLTKAKFDKKEADELAEGFFRVADTKKEGHVNHEEFLAELTRMQTYNVVRSAQFDLAALDAKNGEFDSAHKIELDKLREKFESTGMGKDTVDTQINDLVSVQIGRNVVAFSNKNIIAWYFRKYYTEEPKAAKTETPSSIKFPDAKKYSQELVKSLQAALKKPKAKEKGSEDHTALVYLAGKLMGTMEFVEGCLQNSAADSKQIFGEDEEFEQVNKVIEDCMTAGVEF